MKKILIVCGGVHQVPIVKKAKELGYEVVNSNLYENSPSFKYADHTAVIDVLDYKKNFECAKKYDVDGVIAEQNELSIYTVAYVSEKLGLPSITTERAKLFTNKYLMRRFCEKNGFPYPRYKECNSVEEACAFFEELKGEMIIKPVDSYSSKGVFKIEKLEDCSDYYPMAAYFSRNGKSVIMEEFIHGKEFTVDGIVINGQHYTMAISQKRHYDYNKNIACELYFSYVDDKYDYEYLRNMHNQLIEKTGLEFGLTHSEYKYSNGKYYLIEMAARGGGNYIASKIVPAITGVDTYKLYIQSSVGECPKDSEKDIVKSIKENAEKVAILHFFDICTNGKKVKAIVGIEEIRKRKNVIDIALNFKEGDIVERAHDDGSRPGYVIIIGESKKDLEMEIQKIEKDLLIEVE